MRTWPNVTGEKLRTIVSRSRIAASASAFDVDVLGGGR